MTNRNDRNWARAHLCSPKTHATTFGGVILLANGRCVLLSDNMQQFATNKHVLITGGSEGLGLALAKQLVAHNARVSLVARTKSKLEAAAQAVSACTPNQDRSSQVSWHSADVTNYQQVSQIHSCRLSVWTVSQA